MSLPPNLSENLQLPFIAAAQAMKHVTINEAFRALDALVHVAVITRDEISAPSDPSEGDRYIIGPNAAGAWAGHDHEIAAWQDGAWAFYVPKDGWTAWSNAETQQFVFRQSIWEPLGGDIQTLSQLGIGTPPDALNRLAVNSPSVLISHDGDDIRAIVNKAAPSDTASLIFQTDFLGRAEMGLTGDDDFHFKVSSDGTAWQDAIKIDAATGLCRVEVAAFSATLSATMSNQPAATYNKVNFDQTEFNKGSYFDTATHRFTPPAGLYRLSLSMLITAGEDEKRIAGVILKNGTPVRSQWRGLSGTSSQTASFDGIFEANGTDYFEAATFVDGTIPVSVFADSVFTFFQGSAL